MTASSRWQLEYMKKRDVELEEELKAKGMEFTYPDRSMFKQAAQPAYEALCGRLGKRACEIVDEIKATQ